MGKVIEQLVPDIHQMSDDEKALIAQASERGQNYFPAERVLDGRVREIAHGMLVREEARGIRERRALGSIAGAETVNTQPEQQAQSHDEREDILHTALEEQQID